MERERWEHAKEVLEAALAREPGARAAFVEQACASDPHLQGEVMSLLDSHEEADSFLETPAAHVPTALTGTLTPGTRLGPYEMLAPLGRGGMGEVYRARDTRLDRLVAIKLLPADIAVSPERRQRFEREARAVAALNHPHICTLYDVGRQDPSTGSGQAIEYLVLEYVEGETLADRLSQGTLPLDQILRYATEIAEALDTAHGSGIIHRDLKPANIMLTKSGAKLLDFGLAKLRRMAGAAGDGHPDPVSPEGTLTGDYAILGTLPYMAPEQLEGQTVDARTDVFAFGAVLYEMATGRKAFERKSEASLIAAILERDPPAPSSLRRLIPEALDHLVSRCLAKHPEARWQSAHDLLLDLKWIAEKGRGSSRLQRAARRLARPGWRTALVVGTAVSLVATAYLAWRSFESRQTQAVTPVHRQLTFTGAASDPALSPDGNAVAYLQNDGPDQKLMVQDLGGGQAIEILRAKRLRAPKWSPDGLQIAVMVWDDTSRQSLGAVSLVPRLGGQPRRVGNAAYYVVWSPDGRRLATAAENSKGFTVIDHVPGRTQQVKLSGFTWLSDLDWSSTDRLVLLTRDNAEYALRTVRPDGAEARTLYQTTHTLRSPRWSSSGDSVFVLQQTGGAYNLLKISVRPEVEPATILGGLEAGGGLGIGTRKVLYTRSVRFANLWRLGPRGIATRGPVEMHPITSGRSHRLDASLSPDGTRAVYAEGRTMSNLHILSLANGQTRQLTFFDARSISPAWSADGRWMAFGSNQGGTWRVWLVNPEGGPPRPIESTREAGAALTWAPGRRVLYRTPDARSYMLLDPLTGEQHQMVKPALGGYVISKPRYAPDGQRIAVLRNVGRPMLSVLSIADGRETAVANGDLLPYGWSPDGLWIYAVNLSEGTLVRVPARGGVPELLLKPSRGRVADGSVSPDGRTILCSIAETESDVWLAEGVGK